MPIKFIGSKLYCRVFVVTSNDVLTVQNTHGVGFLREKKRWNFRARYTVEHATKTIPFFLVNANFSVAFYVQEALLQSTLTTGF